MILVSVSLEIIDEYFLLKLLRESPIQILRDSAVAFCFVLPLVPFLVGLSRLSFLPFGICMFLFPN